ncbi:unnamed protein product [Caenorhabditis sp. 36 PRJEB53466]|nr:unnamed protein product [Caenorhabditis sp. 36 PRJEB53466]
MDSNSSNRDSITFNDNILYPIYFGSYFLLTLFSHSSVLLLVILKTPLFFRDFRIFLINSSLLQVLMCSLICFTQVRPVLNPNSTAYLFSGYCKSFQKNVCFFAFDFFQLVFDASAFAIPVTLYYKYSKVTNLNGRELSRTRVRLILFGSFLLSIVVGMIYVVTYRPEESLMVESETKQQFPNNYDYSQYAQITGYQIHFWSSLTNDLNMLSIYTPPIISLVFIRLIQNKLNSLKHMFTDKTIAQARKFDLALSIQTLVPAVCVIPVYTIHLIIEIRELLELEKILYIMLALPTAIDAFIVIFTITPYHNAFISFFRPFFCCKKVDVLRKKTINVSKVTSIF